MAVSCFLLFLDTVGVSVCTAGLLLTKHIPFNLSSTAARNPLLDPVLGLSEAEELLLYLLADNIYTTTTITTMS